jgi:hypothetical protein
MPKVHGKTSPKAIARHRRLIKAFEMREKGFELVEIANALGWNSAQAVHKVMSTAINNAEREAVRHYNELQLNRLEQIMPVVQKKAERGSLKAVALMDRLSGRIQRARNPERKLWIYVVQMQIPELKDLPLKIGISHSPMRRIISFQTAHPYPIRSLGYFPASNGHETERGIHELFSDLRISGEWFRFDHSIAAFVSERVERFRKILESHEMLTESGQQRHIKAWEIFTQEAMVDDRMVD